MRLAREQQDLNVRKQQEEELQNRDISERDRERISTEKGYLNLGGDKFAEEKRATALAEQKGELALTADIDARLQDLRDPRSPNYNPAKADNLEAAYGKYRQTGQAPTAQAPGAQPPVIPVPVAPQKTSQAPNQPQQPAGYYPGGPPTSAPPTAQALQIAAPKRPNKYTEMADRMDAAGMPDSATQFRRLGAQEEGEPPQEAPPAPQVTAPQAAPQAAPPQAPAGGAASDGLRRFNLDEVEAGKQNYLDQIANRIEKASSMGPNDPLKDVYFKTIANGVRTRWLPPDQTDEMAKAFLLSDSAEERARLMAELTGKRLAAQQASLRANLGEREQGSNEIALTHLNQQIDNFLTRPGVYTDAKGHQQLINSLADIKSKNGIQQQGALYSIIRGMQPGDPRISNADYDSINRSAISLFGSWENMLSTLASGEFGGEKVQKMTNVLINATNRSSETLKREMSAFDSQFLKNPTYSPFQAHILQRRQAVFGDLTGAGALPNNVRPGPLPALPGRDTGKKSTKASVSIKGPPEMVQQTLKDGVTMQGKDGNTYYFYGGAWHDKPVAP
jgi:hypothetical protein